MTIKTSKHYQGCYRISNGSAEFGQIRKQGREWHAEIRNMQTGDLVRYAGIWSTKRDAVDECLFILDRDYREAALR
jgi:hypothetical protein